MTKNKRIINRLLNYRNGTHGEFFLSVVDHIKQQVKTIEKLEKEIAELKDEVVKKTKWYEIH